jgi:hypothetical protein
MKPPSPAIWLLDHLLGGPHPAAVAGDLVERFREHRSRPWFWRQTLTAIFFPMVSESRQHKLQTLRILALGFGLWWAAQAAALQIAMVTLPHLLAPPILWSVWLAVLLYTPPAVLTGWLLARLHRPHGAPLVLPFAVLMPAVTVPRLVFLVANALEHERYFPYLTGYILHVIPVAVLAAVCVVAGSLLDTSRMRRG